MAGTNIFISYSHDDEKWRKLVCKQLKVLEREGLIKLWDDQKLRAGEDWKSRIKEELLEARIAVLMISASFLTSDFILDNEVQTLFKRCEEAGTVIYPLLVRPCAWEEVGWLAKKQLRPEGPRVKALASFRGAQREEVIASVAREIANIVRAARPSA
jgi:hypothetical protein